MEILLANILNVSDPYGEVIVIVVAIVSLFKLIDHIINGNNSNKN